MEQRRAAPAGTVGLLAVLTGGLTVGAAAGAGHSVPATALLGLLAAATAHALVDEVRRRAHRPAPWSAADTAALAVLAAAACGSLCAAVPPGAPPPVRIAAGALAAGYAAAGGYLAARRAVARRTGGR